MGARTRELVGFDRATFAHGGRRHDVYRAGAGPAVVVVHELPGIHPGVVELGRRLVAAGCTVFVPSLFGRPGEPLAAAATLRAIVRVCVAREFAILANRTSPVATWLRVLAAEAHGECGGPGVGAIGMCFTGGFALAMLELELEDGIRVAGEAGDMLTALRDVADSRIAVALLDSRLAGLQSPLALDALRALARRVRLVVMGTGDPELYAASYAASDPVGERCPVTWLGRQP